MKPFDPRLLRYARKTLGYIVILGVLGTAAAGLMIWQAQLLAGAIAAGFEGGATFAALRATAIALAAVIAGRALLGWATEAASFRASAAVKSQLRRKLLAQAARLGPRWLAAGAGARPVQGPAAGAQTQPGQGGTAALAELATDGINALDGYFAGYLPQLALGVIVPVAVLTRIGLADPLSAVVIAVTLPLVPLFGALIGMSAGERARQRWLAMARLAHHFADVVAGLPTLKVFGRAGRQRDVIATVTSDYRRATVRTLSLAFLSSLALELVATMSVALVATEIGLRLVYGHLDLRTGLLALILAPEAYNPLRQAGAKFHASADGLAAAGDVFAVLETPLPAAGSGPAPVPAAIRAEGVAVSHPGRPAPAPDGVSLTLVPGQITAVAGPSGSGKTTFIDVLLGFAQPSAGRVLIDGPDGQASDLAGIDPDAWRRRISWSGQDPVLFPGTVESNIRLGWPDAPAAAVAAAAQAAALDDVPLRKRVTERGGGLSAGQRRRVALARALLPGPQQRALLLLDEPTAGLDEATEARVIAALHDQCAAGRMILVASHRRAVLAAADRICLASRPGGPDWPARSHEPAAPAVGGSDPAGHEGGGGEAGVLVRSGSMVRS